MSHLSGRGPRELVELQAAVPHREARLLVHQEADRTAPSGGHEEPEHRGETQHHLHHGECYSY